MQMKLSAFWTILAVLVGVASVQASSAGMASTLGSTVFARRILTADWGGFADAEPNEHSTLMFMRGMAFQPQDNDMKPALAEDGSESAEQMQTEVEKLAQRTKVLGSKGSKLAGELEGVEKELANDIDSESGGNKLSIQIRKEREALCAGQGFHSREHAECEAFMRKNCGLVKSLLQKSLTEHHHHHHHRHNHSVLGVGNHSHNQSHPAVSNRTRATPVADKAADAPKGLANHKRELVENSSNSTPPLTLSKSCMQFFASHEKDEADDEEAAAAAPAAAESNGVETGPAPAAASIAGGPAPGPMPKSWMKVSKSLRPLPEQGYVKGDWGYANEDLVMHQDMRSFVADWNTEFGPRSGQRSFIEICKDFPDNEWCRLHQYVPTKQPDWISSKFGPGGDQEDGAGAGAGAGHAAGGGFLPPWGGAQRMQDFTHLAVAIVVALCMVGM